MKKIRKNSIVVVKHILGETAEALVSPVKNFKYRFNSDAYVVGETCKGGFFHLRQAREFVPGKKLGHNIKFWPRLRKALHQAGVKPVNIPGGDYPIHYVDEVVIPDYKVEGSHFFIVKKRDMGRFLDQLPLDDAGKAHAEEIARRKAETEAEAYRQTHDPKCVANRIGNLLWNAGACMMKGEFKRITLIGENDSIFSIIYPLKKTNLYWQNGQSDVAKVVCAAPETGVEYLSGWISGNIDPKEHWRIRKEWSDGWHCYVAYLMPNPKLATEVRESFQWLNLFEAEDNDGVDAALISNAKSVVIEGFNLLDEPLEERFVYNKKTDDVKKVMVI